MLATTPLDAPTIELAIKGRFGHPLRVFASLGSTNTEAARWAGTGAPHGAVVVADHQTSGRGRRGRSWTSKPGRMVQLSLVLRPAIPPWRAGPLTTAIGLAVAEAVEEVAGLACELKWPNDVTVRDRKLAGVLVETRVAQGLLEVAIAGVGINVAWSCEELHAELPSEATSIACELSPSGRSAPARAEVLGAVLERAEAAYALLVHPAGAARLIERAAERSSVVGRGVSVRLGTGELLEGIVSGLLPSGALEMIVDGEPRAVDAGEIETLGGIRMEPRPRVEGG